MRNIRLLIEYEGTNYAGWQIQPNLPTIQGIIQEKIKTITSKEVKLIAAGRTDAGVHALGQTANFHTESLIPTIAMQTGLNALLPDDIVIKDVVEASPDFDSRRHALSKTYRYLILNRAYPSAIYRNFSWHVFQKLDIDAMKNAAGYLIGKKDFTSFRAAECEAEHPIREIICFSIETAGALHTPSPSPTHPSDGRPAPPVKGGASPYIPSPLAGEGQGEGLMALEVKGTAFLRHMVRIMVGTLVAVGKGKIKPDDFQAIIDARDRRLAGMTAPPQGLFLKEVEY